MWNRVRRRTGGANKGQSLIELALALPMLLIIFLGMIELGFLLRAHLVVVNANREAARFASRGTFSDEQIAERAMTSFAGQLPVNLTGTDANTQIIVTRLKIPSAADEDATYKPQYITGTLGLDSQIDPAAYADKFKYEDYFGSDDFNKDLIDSQPDAVRTMQDVAIVEIYYYHYELLHAPIIEWVFPDPMVVYSRTVMRIGASRVY